MRSICELHVTQGLNKHVCLLTTLAVQCMCNSFLAGFSPDSYASGLSVAVPLLALMGALSLTVEIISAFARYNIQFKGNHCKNDIMCIILLSCTLSALSLALDLLIRCGLFFRQLFFPR